MSIACSNPQTCARSCNTLAPLRSFAIMLLLLPAASGATMGATIAFQPAVSYSVGTNPQAVVVGDFNGDGKSDLAVANAGNEGSNGDVSILLGDGDGTFRAAVNFAAGKNPSAIAAADFNGDKKLDLAVINADGGVGKVGVLSGNGDGTFQSPTDYATGSGPRMIAVGDFNGDHKPDLAIANATDGNVSVLLGNGDGTFQSHIYYKTGGAQGVVVADFNGDGNPDLAVLAGQSVVILAGHQDGTFTQAWASPALGVLVSATAGDYNQDGNLDLVIGVVNSGNVTASHPVLLIGNGDSTFSPGSGIETSHCQNNGPVAADFDGDSKLDLALTAGDGCFPNPVPGKFILAMPGDGKGTFQTAISLTVGSFPTQAAAADLNGDKSPDIVVPNAGDNTISVLLNAVGTDFSISAPAASPITLGPGQSATSTVSLSLLNAFDNPVSLACSVQPAQVGSPTCSLTPDSVTFDASGKASAQLTINAGMAASLTLPSARPDAQPAPLAWLPVAGLALVGAGLGRGDSRKRRLPGFLAASFLCAGLIFQTGCGGSSRGPNSQNYTVTVVGTSGSMQHSVTLTLKVQ